MNNRTRILNTLKEQIAKETRQPVSDIPDDASFYSLGLDSISSIFILDELEKILGISMNPMFFWDYPTVESLADHINSLTRDE
ncbi:MAG: acyl carrier protein [Bacteroidota bacterium]|nr:acyl carrier protein [Bacteroidota bacterium]